MNFTLHDKIIRWSALFLFTTVALFAQTSGKISGVISDAASGESLIGVNIYLDGTELGSTTDEEGAYFILNVPPGDYTLMVEMLGYQTVRMENVRVSVNRTFRADVKLQQSTVAGQEVIVTADRASIKKDQTSSIRNVSAEQIGLLPVENVSEVVALQPGVVVGHFRGGRLTEVSYLVDGVQVDESFIREGQTVELQTEVVEDLEVITGIFNAEYGDAMSGVVNAITKDGGNKLSGSFSSNFANYYTGHKDVFIGLEDSEIDRNQDFKAYLSGPIIPNKLSFLVNARYEDNNNHLNGIRRFLVDDFSDYTPVDPAERYSEANGDGAFVPLNNQKSLSLFGKLTFRPFSGFKSAFVFSRNDDESRLYNHFFKYVPDGQAVDHLESNMFAFHINHAFSKRAFYELKLSQVNNFTGRYVFEDPLDAGYVHDEYARSAGVGFLTGGQQKSHLRRELKDTNIKFDLFWQAHRQHSIKTGFQLTRQNLDQQNVQIRNVFFGSGEETEFFFDADRQEIVYPNYQPVVFPDSSTFSDIYQVKPLKGAFYLQDKMEFENMVINAGLRLDYFDPNTTYPSQIRNPANQLLFEDPDRMSSYPDADPQVQLSPRLGLAYQLGDRALLRFAYGHFFQMPPLFALYQNHSLLVPPNDFAVTTGNPTIKAQKTIQYEIGLWQNVAENMNFEVTIFYRDIYDLLSASIITTFNQIKYGLYSNKDYGNARGAEFKYEYLTPSIFASVNYTLQYTRGNADNPTFTFTRAGESKDPVTRLIPMTWDQRHTFNASVGYRAQRFGATVTGYFNSGTPYTWTPQRETQLATVNLLPNNAYQPTRLSVDLNAHYTLLSFSNYRVRAKMLVFNLLDRLNDARVYGDTGQAYTTIIEDSQLNTHQSDFNEYIDRIQDPSMFDPPRLIKFGLEVQF